MKKIDKKRILTTPKIIGELKFNGETMPFRCLYRNDMEGEMSCIMLGKKAEIFIKNRQPYGKKDFFEFWTILDGLKFYKKISLSDIEILWCEYPTNINNN